MPYLYSDCALSDINAVAIPQGSLAYKAANALYATSHDTGTDNDIDGDCKHTTKT